MNEGEVLDVSELVRCERGKITYVIGIDVGGTFTDAVCADGVNVWRAKSPTNPAQFKDGVLGCCKLLATQMGGSLEELLAKTERFGLGTTAVTNVLATKRGRTVGLLTTAGFEYHLHAMRNHRELVDGWLTMYWNPVDPRAVRGITERIDRSGNVITSLNPAEVETAVHDLVANHGVNAFAVSFLWSFRNPEHERQTVEIIKRLYPGMAALSGAELHPIMREYERTTLAVLNAFTSDALDGVEELESELRQHGLATPMLLLHSGGGAITVAEARATPLALASSGPAAGAVAASEIAVIAGYSDALCCDMGGTSIDVAVVSEGVAERRLSADIGGMVTGQSAIDVESIGAGGGSIAWIDARALLRVGPQSARATPGPVCYGRGGTEPTVTDAMLVLGYIDPNAFMGGSMQLDVEGARAACARLGERIGMSAMEIARGIREIALAEMSKAMRARISTGGIDVRKFGVVAFGGCGSLFTSAMAKELELAWVLTPAIASVLSAYGAATADIRRERSQAINKVLPFDPAPVAKVLEVLQRQAAHDLEIQGVPPKSRKIVSELELRFFRQRTSITLEIDENGIDSDALQRRFNAAYAERYGASGVTSTASIELSTLRVTGIGRTVRARLPVDREPVAPGTIAEPRAKRAVYMARDKMEMIPVYDTAEIRIGHVVRGPALFDTIDTTLWAPPGSIVTAVRGGSLKTSFGA